MSQLYEIVDTNFFYSIWGKENFIRRINYIYTNIKNCGFMGYDSIKAVVINQTKTTEYIVPLCSENKSSSQSTNSLVISFADYTTKNKILFFEVRTDLFDNDSSLLKKMFPERPVNPGQ